MSEGKRIAIMQPYFFPYLGYFQLMQAVDEFVIYDDVNFIKGGWINRNRILINGEVKYFNILLEGASSQKKINDISLLENGRWKKKLLRKVEQAYSKAPFFDRVMPLFEDCVNCEETNLASFLSYSLKKTASFLKVNTTLINASGSFENSNLLGSERVLDICLQRNKSVYINPQGGKALYSKDEFQEKGVQLNFLVSDLMPYKQGASSFVPGLSMLDVMMHNPLEDVQMMLSSYDLM
jgi:hypothetical protein